MACLLANLGRATCFPVLFLFALMGKPLFWLVVASCCGEVLALALLLVRTRRLHGLSVGLSLKPLFLSACAIVSAGAISAANGPSLNAAAVAGAGCVVGLSCLAALLLFPDFRRRLISAKEIRSA